MKTYLYLLSIGPVQSFISQARKTQDLYEGSRLLSLLCREGMQYTLNALPGQARCIFPADPKSPSVPNRFLIQLQTNKEPAELAAFARKAKKHIKKEAFLKKYALEGRLERIKGQEGSPDLKARLREINIKKVKKQLKELLDIQWAIVPVESNYLEAYEQAERLLRVAKNTVPFGAFTDQEAGRKCSVCGERNVRYYRCSPNETESIFPGENGGLSDEQREESLNHLWGRKLFQEPGEVAVFHTWDSGARLGWGDLQPGEGLCGVCAAKRFNLGYDFPSTAEVALMDTFEKAMKLNGAVREIVDYIECFSQKQKPLDHSFNWQFFYEENISSIAAIEKAGFPLKRNKAAKLKEIQEKHLALRQKLQQLGLPLTKYYCLVLFDGDRMGEWLSGRFLDAPEETLEQFHAELSKLLSAYAKWVSTYLKAPQGEVIYAGGDDFLGLVNLQYLYEVLDMLREQFDCQVNQKLKAKFEGQLNEEAEDFTFSAGVAIAHYKTPLQEVLNQARRIEQLAKEKGGRNALALGLILRTGQFKATYWKWRYNQNKLLSLLQKANALLRPDVLSDTFARALIQHIQPIMERSGTITCTPYQRDQYAEMVSSELNRLLPRSRGFLLPADELQEFADNLSALLASEENEEVLYSKESGQWNIQNFLALLELMLFVSNHTIAESSKMQEV